MKNYYTLKNPQSLEDHKEVSILLSNIIECIVCKNPKFTVNKIWEIETLYFGQMIYSKLKHLILLSDGFELIDDGKKFIDPCIHFIISRNILESVVYFNLQHIYHNSEEEKNLIYRLWRLSSLKYRQRLIGNNPSPEVSKLSKEESDEIDTIKNEIINSDIYNVSNQETKNQIDKCIKKKEFWIVFDNGIANSSLGLQQICDKITNQSSLLESQYTRYSLFTHPSNETALMFKNMFKMNGYEVLAGYNLRITNCLIAMFIMDYIQVYPLYKDVYESINQKNTTICKYYNKLIRN